MVEEDHMQFYAIYASKIIVLSQILKTRFKIVEIKSKKSVEKIFTTIILNRKMCVFSKGFRMGKYVKIALYF